MAVMITDRNAVWIAKALRDFADQPGLTHTKACKLRGAAHNLEKKAKEPKNQELSDCPYCGRPADA